MKLNSKYGCVFFSRRIERYLFLVFLLVASVNAASQTNTLTDSTGIVADTLTNDTIYSFATEMPQYPGGDVAMMEFIRRNIVFPESVNDREMFVATTYVEYVVEKDGQVSNVKPLKNPNSDIAKQLVRIVKTFPKYSPGKIDGKPVRVRMMVPLRIKLQ